MDNLLKLIKQILNAAGTTFPALNPKNLPKPVMVILMYFGITVGVLGVLKTVKLGQTEKTLVIALAVVLAVTTTGFFIWKSLKQKKQNQQFGGDIAQHSSATPRGVSDPGQRARLDDLRKKFQSGIEAYKSRGKDLYKLPWYAIVGEPGSGKTEAVRHSNVGFPPGMQDEFQGVGGTINMNWWFTNHAVLLDTAGRLMFEEVKPGETSEWKEFLGLLKKNRPNCPINGLFLVIPSDSLIKDSADAIQQKAGKIAQQLDVIQRVLDVRFPVFVVVTKCDKINGFREFFDSLTDPQLQHQMTGWSNPAPLDEPFKPELVDKHLEQVVERLRRRRLGLMRDPVPENPDGRRTDEVDSLYAFPHSMIRLGSRLRRYLETIFIAGEWSAKPLFLRGIYFSSSMREGSALDAELAEAIGVAVEDLPEGKVWERERAYFLRDLFLEKVFREKGLVTRASNTKRMLRSQQIALYGFGFLSLAVFAAVGWFAMRGLKGGVKDQGDYWHMVSAAGWENNYWKQSIVPIRGDGSFAPTISTNSLVVDNKSVTLGEFHRKLRDLAETPLRKNLMFPGLADKYNKNRGKAQRIVFEAGVVRPLIEATRQKISRDDGTDSGSSQYQPDALATLIQLEADILARGTGTNKGELTEEGAKKFLGTLQNYVAGKEAPVDSNLVAVMSWTYSSNETAKGAWVPRGFTGARGGTNSLAANPAINSGLEWFIRSATNSVHTYGLQWNQIASLRASAQTFTDYESALFAAAKGGAEAKFLEALRALETARTNLDTAVANALREPLFAGGLSLTNAQQRFREGVTRSAGAALDRVRGVNEAALAANKDYPLFNDIKARLDTVQASLSNVIARLLQEDASKDFRSLDEMCLVSSSFIKRAAIYSRMAKLAEGTPFAGQKLVGLKGDQLAKALKDATDAARVETAEYTGGRSNELAQVLAYQLKRAEKAQSEAFFAAWLAEAKLQLAADGFPLVRDPSRMMTVDRFMAAQKNLKYISDDLVCELFKKQTPRDRSDDWKKFIPYFEGQQVVAKALMGDEGMLGGCTIILAGMADATRAKDEWRDKWRDLKLTLDGGGGETIRTQSDRDQELGRAPVQHSLELRLWENAGAPTSLTFTNRTAAWGPLWLIHQHKGARVDPNTWLVEFPVGAPGAAGLIRLKLRFDRQLDLDKWPAPELANQ